MSAEFSGRRERRKAEMSRRVLLRAIAGVSLAGSVVVAAPRVAPCLAAPSDGKDNGRAINEDLSSSESVLTRGVSTNGWEMETRVNDHGSIYTRPVPGTPLSGVDVRIGPVEGVLAYFLWRYHCDVDRLYPGAVSGWRHPDFVKSTNPESNLASGTAVSVREGMFPVGVRGGLFPAQERALRLLLEELNGVLRWAGDDNLAQEGLFYVQARPADFLAAEQIPARAVTPFAGGGALR